MTFLLFLAAACVIALSPRPGIFYVAARTLADGRATGLASSLGTGLGGLVHVAAGAIGVSALIMASAEAFALLKIAGAIYLIWLGLKTAREAGVDIVATARGVRASRAFRDGIVVEAVDVVVVVTAARARSMALARPSLLRRLRMGAGLAIAGLGLSLLFARRPAAL